jgi:hypothetical protein
MGVARYPDLNIIAYYYCSLLSGCKGTLFDYYSGFDFRRAITDPIASLSGVTWRVASFVQVQRTKGPKVRSN